jgi:hypothetical protein
MEHPLLGTLVTADMVTENPEPVSLDEERVREIVREVLFEEGLLPGVFAACYYSGY